MLGRFMDSFVTLYEAALQENIKYESGNVIRFIYLMTYLAIVLEHQC